MRYRIPHGKGELTMKFTVLTEENQLSLINDIAAGADVPRDLAEELIASLTDSAEEDTELALTVAFGCVCVRIFEYGEYIFLFPIDLSDEADARAALDEVVKYAVAEDVPVKIADIPREELSLLFDLGYRHIDIDATDPDGECFSAVIKSECALVTRVPEISDGRLTLNALTLNDEAAYARLSREETGLEFWGYDYRIDRPDAPDGYFIATALEERAMGVALSLGARLEGELIGEVVFHAYDRKGGADFAFRLLPEYRGRGLGARLYELAVRAARAHGLVKLFGRVMKKNVACLSLIEKRMELIEDDGEVVNFTLDLY